MVQSVKKMRFDQESGQWVESTSIDIVTGQVVAFEGVNDAAHTIIYFASGLTFIIKPTLAQVRAFFA